MSESQQNTSILTFRVGQFNFCVNAAEAEAIIEAPQIRPVPMMPKSIAGIFSYRQEVVVVISLRSKLGLQASDDISSGQIILTRINKELKGFQVDEVLELLDDPNLIGQALPYFDKNSVVNHLIVKDNDILLHTDFKGLFNASDSEISNFLLTSITGELRDEGSSKNRGNEDKPAMSAAKASKITAANAHKTNGQNQARQRTAQLFDDIIKTEHISHETKYSKPEGATVTAAAFQKHDGKSNYRKHTEQVKKITHMDVGSAVGSNFRSTYHVQSGQTDGLNRKRGIAAGSRDYFSQTSQKTRQDKPQAAVGKGFWWKRLTAACLLLAISGALVIWRWPIEHLESHDPIIAKASGIEATTIPLEPLIQKPESTQRALQKTSAEPINKKKLLKESVRSAPPQNPAVEYKKPQQTEGLSHSVEQRVMATPVSRNAPERNTDIPVSSPFPEFEKPASKPPLDSASAWAEKKIATPNLPGEKEISEEVLRVETEEFTLMIERPVSPLPAVEQKEGLPETAAGETIHIVVRGDTLWDIAKEYLGDPFRYPELAKLSRIKDPDWIYPGDLIRIIRKKTSKKRISQG